MGTELLWPSATAAVRGSVLLGIWGRAEEGSIAFLGFFSSKEGMQGIYPHPKHRDMGLLSWIISRYMFLLPVGGLGSCDTVSPPPSPLSFSITSYSSRCA